MTIRRPEDPAETERWEAEKQRPEPARGMTYDRLVLDEELVTGPDLSQVIEERLAGKPYQPPAEGPVCSVEVIVEKRFIRLPFDARTKLVNATGVADITFEAVGDSHTRVILRPTKREAASLILTAVYSDVVNGVKQ